MGFKLWLMMRKGFALLGVMLILLAGPVVEGSSDKKPHGHNGILPQFDGSILPCKMSKDQEVKLGKGEPVSAVTKEEGKAFVVQDIEADPAICMNFIKDIQNYHKYVKSVKKVTIYEKSKDFMGNEKMKATYDVAVFGIKFRYFMIHTFNPRLNTFTWTLDYSRSSDFDDNVGHWQVVRHPSKAGCSRVLYSCQIKLFSWVPGVVVNFLTKTALIEATRWVKTESEALAIKQPARGKKRPNNLWFSGKAQLNSIGNSIRKTQARDADFFHAKKALINSRNMLFSWRA